MVWWACVVESSFLYHQSLGTYVFRYDSGTSQEHLLETGVHQTFFCAFANICETQLVRATRLLAAMPFWEIGKIKSTSRKKWESVRSLRNFRIPHLGRCAWTRRTMHVHLFPFLLLQHTRTSVAGNYARWTENH
jgi:hypothetical protein